MYFASSLTDREREKKVGINMRHTKWIIGIVAVGVIVVLGMSGTSWFSGFTAGFAAPPTNTAQYDLADISSPPPSAQPEEQQPTAHPMEIQIIPLTVTAEPVELLPVPTAEPAPSAPESAGLAAVAEEDIIYRNGFEEEADVEGWEYEYVLWEPLNPPTWQRSTDGTFFPPEDRNAMNILNDTLALAPAELEGDGTIEVSALPYNASKTGIVLGYVDQNNYAALIFGAEDAAGIGKPGLSIMQVVDGVATVLAHDAETIMEYDQWHQLHLEQQGNTLTAQVDGGTPLTADLPTAVAGKIGLYAGAGNYVYFDNISAWK
jgi:hypothetical protein